MNLEITKSAFIENAKGFKVHDLTSVKCSNHESFEKENSFKRPKFAGILTASQRSILHLIGFDEVAARLKTYQKTKTLSVWYSSNIV